MQIKVYIIIVTYNGMQWLSKCLDSTKDIPVIIVDNCSCDGTVNFIQSNYPEITLLQQKNNLGFGAANNIGISHALKNRADYVFLLNQDAYLQEYTIEKLIEVHKSNSEYGIISPIHLNGSGSHLDKNFSNYIKINDSLFYDALKHNFTKPIYNVPFVNAAAWLLPRVTLETIGGFDPVFFHYGEDDNYCQRVLFHGLKIGVVPKIYLNHDRETRIVKQDTDSDNEIFERLERAIKIKYANINREDVSEFKKLIKKSVKSSIKLFIKLRFNSSKFYRTEARLLKKIYPEIMTSRLLNLKKGANHLNL